MKTADLQHTRWAFKSTRLCSGSCLCTDGTLTTADDDTMKSRNNRSLSGDSVPLPGRVPEGCLLSCILKEIFSQNKPAQSVIKAPRWQSCPFMCSPLGALPFLLKRSQPSPSPSRSNNSTKVAYKTEVPGLMGWDAFEAAAKRHKSQRVRLNRMSGAYMKQGYIIQRLSSFVQWIHFEEHIWKAALMWMEAKHSRGHVQLRIRTASPSQHSTWKILDFWLRRQR